MAASTPGLDDERLLLDYARTRNARSLEVLVERHWAEAYRLSLRTLGDPGVAEDAAQEAFVKLVRGAYRFQEGRPFRPWFRTLVLNSARLHARTRRTRQLYEQRVSRTRGAATSAEGERRLEAAEVEASLAELPSDLRFPLVLHFYEGWSHEEVAVALGCPKGTASSRIRRGLEKLRETLVGAGFATSLTEGVLESLLERSRSSGARPTKVPAPPSVALLESAARTMAKASRVAFALKALGALVALGAAASLVAVIASPSGARPNVAPGSPVARGDAPGDDPVHANSATPTNVATNDRALTKGSVAVGEGILVTVRDPSGSPVPGVPVAVDGVFDSMSQEVETLRRLPVECIASHYNLVEHADTTAVTNASGVALVAPGLRHSRGDTVVVFARRGLLAAASPRLVFPGSGTLPVELRLEAPEAIAPGRGAIVVHVTRSGEPLPDADVDADLQGAPEDGWIALQCFRTDQGGSFALHSVLPGSYKLAIAFNRLLETENKDLALTVRAGEVTRVDVDLDRLAALKGRVLGPEGRPPAGTSVFLHGGYGESVTGPDESGFYRIGLVSLTHKKHPAAVDAFAPGFGRRSVKIAVTRRAEIPVPDLELGKGASFKARVLSAGRPLSKALVALWRDNGLGVRETVGYAFSADDGSVAIQGLSEGPAGLAVFPEPAPHTEKAGWGDYFMELGQKEGSPRKEFTAVTVPAEGELLGGDLDVTLLTVKGRVLDPAGKPVERAHVLVSGDEGIREASSDKDGRFTIDGLRAGSHAVVASAHFVQALVLGEPLRVEFAPGASPELELRLSGGASISGTVKGGQESLEVVAFPYVEGGSTVARLLGPVTARVDREGHFEIAALAPGKYGVSVPGLSPVEIVTVGEGARAKADLALEPRTGRIHLRVTLPAGDPEARVQAVAWVGAFPMPWGASVSYVDVKGGEALLENVAHGAVTVMVDVVLTKGKRDDCDLFVFREGVTVGEGAPSEVSLVVPERSNVGEIRGKIGHTRTDQQFHVFAVADGVAFEGLERENDEAFSMKGVPAGAYRVFATDGFGFPVRPASEGLVVVEPGKATGELSFVSAGVVPR